jgi:hypothetical protein
MSATAFGQFWGAVTTDGTLNGATIAGGSNSSPGDTINNYAASPNEVLDTELELAIAYGVTISGGGCVVYICRSIDGTNFESPTNDAPYSFTMPAVASTTVRRLFTVSGADVGTFHVVVGNPSTNSTVTATLRYRQSQGQSG